MVERSKIIALETMPIEEVAKRLGMSVERHKTICPFHNDSHPSLTFNTFRNRYKCYVCNAGGGTIDLVMKVRNCNFLEACQWLDSSACEPLRNLNAFELNKLRKSYPPDTQWLSVLVSKPNLIPQAQDFLFVQRHLNPNVIRWCGVSSTDRDLPCWRYGKPFYDAPSLLIPYYDQDGRLLSVQGRYLGEFGKPRFKFPMGSNCHIYNLPILKLLKENEELWITEGCSDCWAMLSSGKKAVAIPSATLLKREDVELLRGLNLHMFPDHDEPGERLFMELRKVLPQIRKHELPVGFKDFGDYYAYTYECSWK